MGVSMRMPNNKPTRAIPEMLPLRAQRKAPTQGASMTACMFVPCFCFGCVDGCAHRLMRPRTACTRFSHLLR